jgi:uncharacterized membrane protein
MTTKPDNEILDSMWNDPKNWKGLIYFNRNDPRLWVPKIAPSFGWTLNFANPYAYLMFAAIIVLVIACNYL